jgi:hypothetical protein
MEFPASHDDGRPPFNAAMAEQLRGSYVLLGVTIERADGELKRHEQFHGVVTEVDAHRGITIALRGNRAGQTKSLPPAVEAFSPAPKGTYSLHSTGEEVVDPDFLATFTLVQPDA